MTEVQLADH